MKTALGIIIGIAAVSLVVFTVVFNILRRVKGKHGCDCCDGCCKGCKSCHDPKK